MIEAALSAIYPQEEPTRRIRTLFKKIRRLWSARNKLAHSHYVFNVQGRDNLALMRTSVEGETLSDKSLFSGPTEAEIRAAGKEEVLLSIKYGPGEFGYVGKTGDPPLFTPVNRSTFDNHAAEVSKRVAEVIGLLADIRHGQVGPSDEALDKPPGSVPCSQS